MQKQPCTHYVLRKGFSHTPFPLSSRFLRLRIIISVRGENGIGAKWQAAGPILNRDSDIVHIVVSNRGRELFQLLAILTL